MWIKNSNGAASNLKVPGMDEPVDIPESGVLQVQQEAGESLIEHCPPISEHTPEE